MLDGQKLQGVETSRELHLFLAARGKTADYPLFDVVVSFFFLFSFWLLAFGFLTDLMFSFFSFSFFF